jgi:hypothetical protein
MSVNRYQPHVLVLPEDDANRQLANGFLLGLNPSVFARIQVLEEAGGWVEVLNRFESDHVAGMDRYIDRYMVLMIDFDGDEERLHVAEGRIPQHLRDRVFVLGALTEPEALRSAGLGSYETIGREAASDCRDDTDSTWGHDLLRHNAGEIARLRQHVRPILFQ